MVSTVNGPLGVLLQLRLRTSVRVALTFVFVSDRCGVLTKLVHALVVKLDRLSMVVALNLLGFLFFINSESEVRS